MLSNARAAKFDSAWARAGTRFLTVGLASALRAALPQACVGFVALPAARR